MAVILVKFAVDVDHVAGRAEKQRGVQQVLAHGKVGGDGLQKRRDPVEQAAVIDLVADDMAAVILPALPQQKTQRFSPERSRSLCWKMRLG